MRVMNLRKIDVLKAGFVSAVLYFIMGLLIVLLYGAIGMAIIRRVNPGLAALGVVLIILIPLIYAAIGFVIGLIFALLLNLSLSIIKGLPLYFEEETQVEGKEVSNEIQPSESTEG